MKSTTPSPNSDNNSLFNYSAVPQPIDINPENSPPTEQKSNASVIQERTDASLRRRRRRRRNNRTGRTHS